MASALPLRQRFCGGQPFTSMASSLHHAQDATAAVDNITIRATHTHSCSRLLSRQAGYVTHRVWRHMKSSRSPSLSDPVRNQRNLQYSIFQAQKACWIYVLKRKTPHFSIVSTKHHGSCNPKAAFQISAGQQAALFPPFFVPPIVLYLTHVTQGVHFVLFMVLSVLGSMSPWAKATSHHIMAKSNQLHRKDMVKMTSVWRHFRSTKVVKISCRNRPCSRMFLCARLHAPFLAMKRALRGRSRMRGLRRFSAAIRASTYSSGIILFRASIFLPP